MSSGSIYGGAARMPWQGFDGGKPEGIFSSGALAGLSELVSSWTDRIADSVTEFSVEGHLGAIKSTLACAPAVSHATDDIEVFDALLPKDTWDQKAEPRDEASTQADAMSPLMNDWDDESPPRAHAVAKLGLCSEATDAELWLPAGADGGLSLTGGDDRPAPEERPAALPDLILMEKTDLIDLDQR